MRKIILLVFAPLFLLVTVKVASANSEVVIGQENMVSITALMTYEEFAEHQIHLMNLTNNEERNEYIQEYKTIIFQRATDRGVSIAGMDRDKIKSINTESKIEFSGLSDE